jgi:hypothetical protein
MTTAKVAKAAKLRKEKPYAILCALRVLGGRNFRGYGCTPFMKTDVEREFLTQRLTAVLSAQPLLDQST